MLDSLPFERTRGPTQNTYAVILAGGRGSRLGRLTDQRAKPAVPFGGNFRIIDFTLSNCVNSGIRQIGVATRYKAPIVSRIAASGRRPALPIGATSARLTPIGGS